LRRQGTRRYVPSSPGAKSTAGYGSMTTASVDE
jgi:hypothetical protein